MKKVPTWAWWTAAGAVFVVVVVGIILTSVLREKPKKDGSSGVNSHENRPLREVRIDIPITTEFTEIDLVHDHGVPLDSDLGLYPEKGKILFVEYKGALYKKDRRDGEFTPSLPILRDPDLNIRARGSRAMRMTVIARQ
ncbi:MAG: hypothetical protein Q8P01_03875 [bacterium]|nr:hypothetical protein [bacterium]